MNLGYNMNSSDVLLFSGNKWLLYKLTNAIHWDSWVYHCCNPMAAKFTVNRFLTWTEMDHHPVKCWKCQEVCPDDIVTLWKLHNFDGIQSGMGEKEMQLALNEYWVDLGR